MKFFQSAVVRAEMAEISELQEEVYSNIFKFPSMKKEDQLYHVEILERLLEKQKVLYARLSLSDDPDAKEMKENIMQSAASMGLPANVDVGKMFDQMSDVISHMKEALELLDEWGYVNIVGLKGGYNMWNRQWDQNMRRRNLPGNFKEEFSHGAEGMGVHGTGASFQNQDAFQYADWKDSTKWMEWTSGTIPADE